VIALLALGCIAGQGFLFAPAESLEQLSGSPFVARRNALCSGNAGREDIATRDWFKPPRALRRRAGAA